MAELNRTLTEAESGWTRYDNNNANITNIGSVVNFEDTVYWGSNINRFSGIGSGAKFNFTGTKLRVIGKTDYSSDTSYSVNVYIDGVSVGNFSQYQVGGTYYRSLNFEITGLTDKEHYVTITNNCTGCLFYFDAIDIADTAILKVYNENLIHRLFKNENNKIYGMT
jgi:hypothetical protein